MSKQNSPKYKNRPSPPYKANDYCGKKKTGNDGYMYESVPDKNGVCRWKLFSRHRKVSEQKQADHLTPDSLIRHFPQAKTSFVPKSRVSSSKLILYEIHDNGGRPFLFVAGYGRIELYRKSRDNPFKSYTSFLGFWNGYDPAHNFTGSSILIQLSKKRYVYVGDVVYEFSLWKDQEIYGYISEVGNSDVPYPYAIGDENTYLMAENVIIPNELLHVNPYEEYYGHTDPVPAKEIKKHSKKIKKKIIYK